MPEGLATPHPRATREAGRQTRRALLDAAGRLFGERGVAGVSAAEIAREAGAFPSQVTYYFGSKEALFVEAATLVRHRPDLAPRVRETFARLHLEGERAVAESLVARGWQIRAAPATEARGFWASVLGIALERAAAGDSFDDATADATVQLVLNLYTEPRAGRRG